MKPRLAQTLELVRLHQPTTRKEVAKALGVAAATASIYLQDLQQKSLIRSTGLGCRAAWMMGKPQEASSPPPSSVWDLAKVDP